MKAVFNLASFLTSPICKARDSYWLGKALQKSQYTTTILFFVVGIILAPIGMLVRFVAAKMTPYKYLYEKGLRGEKNLDKSFSILTWNVCFVPAGYSITDGGVFPWKDRITGVVEKIKQADADVVCLMEVFDYDAVTCLLKRLKKDYAYFYFNIGPKAIGVSSGFFIASNIAIEDPEFVRFPKEHLIGRTKNAAKGLFSFILGNKISILLTHLQHSEECEFPTKEEVVARNHQMNMVMQFAESKTIPVIITGDLNLDEEEFNNTHWSKDVNRGVIPLEKTWRGDEFVARLMNKKPSRALTYDYTMSFNDDNVNIKTSYVETGYDPRVFKREALSDHLGLLSVISFK